MTTAIYCDPTKHHDFLLLFDVTNGNPNGDPDAGNQPRFDPETMHGIVSDVCLKRKVRDWVDMTHGGESRFEIYIQSRDIGLNDLHAQAHQALFSDTKEANESDPKRQRARRDWLCQRFYDVRTFGAVMTTGEFPSGQIRGPIQMNFARSIDPITPLEIAITRVAVAAIDPKKKTTSTMGRKSIIPYGLYLAPGFYVPHYGKQTQYSSEDLQLFWQALTHMWDVDRSAARGMLSLQGLCIFSHENPLRNAPAHQLFKRLTVAKHTGIVSPRHIADYQMEMDEKGMPEGITVTKLVWG